MINESTLIKKTIREFEEWFHNDPHSENQYFYKNSINQDFLNSLLKEEFINFFYDFVINGGKVQSGGSRSINKFLNTITKDFNSFKSYVLEPFSEDFKLKSWFNQIIKYNGFGVGIATIYLNRVDNDTYPIMNNKTINALNQLGYPISLTKNYKNYQKVKDFQDILIKKFPKLDNYYKIDSFNHFIVAIYDGIELISGLNQIRNLENELEQNEIHLIEEAEIDDLNKVGLLEKIEGLENNESESITVKGKRYKRHNYLMVLIKKYRNFKCQFCATQIKKSNGGYYIEACHIKPKSKGGVDKLDNILVLCPNCHKLFDYGKREEEMVTDYKYSVKINGKRYKANMK
jgi:hypothetical protein